MLPIRVGSTPHVISLLSDKPHLHNATIDDGGDFLVMRFIFLFSPVDLLVFLMC